MYPYLNSFSLVFKGVFFPFSYMRQPLMYLYKQNQNMLKIYTSTKVYIMYVLASSHVSVPKEAVYILVIFEEKEKKKKMFYT